MGITNSEINVVEVTRDYSILTTELKIALEQSRTKPKARKTAEFLEKEIDILNKKLEKFLPSEAIGSLDEIYAQALSAKLVSVSKELHSEVYGSAGYNPPPLDPNIPLYG